MNVLLAFSKLTNTLSLFLPHYIAFKHVLRIGGCICEIRKPPVMNYEVNKRGFVTGKSEVLTIVYYLSLLLIKQVANNMRVLGFCFGVFVFF